MTSDTITLNGITYVPADSVDRAPSETQIVVAQRGWVFVGRVRVDDEYLVIEGAKNIRKWGTTKGLGELVNGPLADTKTDDYGTVRVHRLAVVAQIDADAASWA